ncbi:MAG: hypothetical protein HW401_348 [Parcubacteria group bacterium]|nr:hypothetical protein [Parcubacteria group bacterium]
MCDGNITDPVSKPRDNTRKNNISLRFFLKNYWEKITHSSDRLVQIEVNVSLKRGDLEMSGESSSNLDDLNEITKVSTMSF